MSDSLPPSSTGTMEPPDTLERYLAGELDRPAAGRVERWLAMHPEADTVIRAFVAEVTDADVAVPDRHVAVQQLRERIGEVSGQSIEVPSAKGSSGARRRVPGGRLAAGGIWRSGWYAVAGVLLGVALMLGWNVTHHAARRSSASSLTYATANGERATITLPDGGTVLLNVASRLRVPVDYAAGDRTLSLEGEALFTVAHHDGAPFTVSAGGATARVLGTSFVVRRYATDTTTMVAVRDGKVAVRSLVLTAGRQVEIRQKGLARVGGTDVSLFSFASGVLSLGGVPLPQAIPDLDRWYGVDIRLGDSTLATRRIKGELTAGSLTDLTALLELTFGVSVVRDGRVLTLYPRQ